MTNNRYDDYDYKRYQDYWDVWYGSGAKKGGYSYTTGKYEHRKIEREEFIETLVKNIKKTLDVEGNIILIEPSVELKMKQMMFSMNKLEVYGKLIVETEEYFKKIYPVVKDVLIPYQNVTTAHFESTEEQMGAWMHELNRTEDGSLRPVKEVNELTKRLLGHFHSHDSVGSVKYSYTDTEDVEEHREDSPFWIEVIGNRKEFAGRIAFDKPMPIIAKATVITKWWVGMEDTVMDLEDKVFEEKWISTYKKKEQEKETKTGDKDIKEVKVTVINEGKRLSYGDYVVVDWDIDDPIQLPDYSLVSEEKQKTIARIFQQAIYDGEKIMIEVWSNNDIDWLIYNEDGYVDMLLNRLAEDEPRLLEELYGISDEAGAIEDFSYLITKSGESKKIERTITWDDVKGERSKEIVEYDPLDDIGQVIEETDIEEYDDDDALIRELMLGEVWD